ncbi:hypothetical protein E4U30_001748 [Claviceps sp. LM220 group G6]|nr:hypothetical protein E4U15_001493 [Claviceps sp. LM218 group G6]KAG6096147.1 hypothetical protein E4U30_001748 [Claviceps sp. LM220 group G6]KAG6101036.1 hypothetical protein E4U31_003764 [Claviceps sp. LM219 group G6]KAG6105365.1 hypothetical protein E4U14_005148 [Claviceps sp. LM454 group G7]
MKFSPFLALALAGISMAQSIGIRKPRPGASLDRGTPIPITIQTPTDGLKLREVSLVISMASCPDGKCPNAGDNIGMILYAGPFNPQAQGTATPQETFNITIPNNFPTGAAELLATHFLLVGEGGSPRVQIAGEIVYVESSDF